MIKVLRLKKSSCLSLVCKAVFELLGFEYVPIRSEKTMKLRQEAVATFCDPNSRCDVSVCSFACGGFGVNL